MHLRVKHAPAFMPVPPRGSGEVARLAQVLERAAHLVFLLHGLFFEGMFQQ
jgi:hypothetical protein